MRINRPDVFDDAVQSLLLHREEFASIQRLELQNITDKPIEKLIEFLKKILPTLKELSFINCNISKKNMEVLRDAIQKEGVLKNIVKLEFINTRIGCHAFVDLLQTVNSLKELTYLHLDLHCQNAEQIDQQITRGDVLALLKVRRFPLGCNVLHRN